MSSTCQNQNQYHMKAKMSDSKQILRKREGAWGVGWKEEERGEEEAEGMCYCVRSCVSECVFVRVYLCARRLWATERWARTIRSSNIIHSSL